MKTEESLPWNTAVKKKVESSGAAAIRTIPGNKVDEMNPPSRKVFNSRIEKRVLATRAV
jgi:hypothetical protein